MRLVASFLVTIVLVFLVACDSDDNGDRSGVTPPAETPASATPGTSNPAASATPGSTPPRTDGTVPAQGFGSKDPVTIKSLPDPAPGSALLDDVRIGAHPEEGGWDRIVFEFRGHRPAGKVEYVDRVAYCGSGEPVTNLPGTALLKVRFDGTDAHNQAGQTTIDSTTVSGPGGAILRAIQTCDFEAIVEWVVAVDAKERMNVRFLESPNRVVIDIKW
jgi:hypothetical protein